MGWKATMANVIELETFTFLKIQTQTKYKVYRRLTYDL